MTKRFRKLFLNILLFALVFTRVFWVFPVNAIEVPTMPPAPPVQESAPTVPPPPDAASYQPVEVAVPTVDAAPTVPPAGSLQDTSVPTVPPVNSDNQSQNNASNPSTSPTGTNASEGTGQTGNQLGDGSLTAQPTGETGATGEYGEGFSSGDVNDPANITTGFGSTNYASEVLDQKLETLNKNLAELQNTIDQISSTGFNFANLNTLDGQVFSGSSLSTLNLLNKLNSNMTGQGGFSVFNIYDTHVGDIVFQMGSNSITGGFSQLPTVSKNEGTGAFSTNTADAQNSFKVKEATGNDALLTNDINLQALTGGNSAAFNTGNGVVKTGDAFAAANVVNLTNTNINASEWLFGVVNIFGTLAGNIILPTESASTGSATAPVYVGNSATGAGSENSSSYTNNETAEFNNTNVADINSNLNVTANTGNNDSSMNTGGGYIESGDAEVGVSNTTIANVNTVQEDDTVWMVIVNEMGKWVGHIYGAAWGDTSASNALPLSQNNDAGNQSFSTLVDNNATGAFSENTSNYESNSEQVVENANVATIQNNITVEADTGNNVASNNTGAGVIQTGDAKAGLNLVNIANTNVTAKKFIAILVNVIGDFLGDIITPEYQADSSGTGYIPVPTAAPYLSPTPTPVQMAGTSSSPTPTPVTENNENAGIGGTQTNSSSTQQNYEYDYTDFTYYQYDDSYAQATIRTNNQRNVVTGIGYSYSYGVPEANPSPASSNDRGIFMSPNFLKATESSLAGMLLSGFKWKVSDSWLSIVPFAVFLFLLRRRKKYNLGKYININALLEVFL